MSPASGNCWKDSTDSRQRPRLRRKRRRRCSRDTSQTVLRNREATSKHDYDDLRFCINKMHVSQKLQSFGETSTLCSKFHSPCYVSLSLSLFLD